MDSNTKAKVLLVTFLTMPFSLGIVGNILVKTFALVSGYDISPEGLFQASLVGCFAGVMAGLFGTLAVLDEMSR